MKIFEYTTRHISGTNGDEILVSLGIEGWELVSVSNGIGYFKREKTDQTLLNESSLYSPATIYLD